ncbi:hypothetical protein N8A25_000505 [Enterococcus faecium]|nr:hypothetical protein [Enterococcus faecium]
MSHIVEKIPLIWTPPEIPNEIPHGDMPGDKVVIDKNVINKTQLIFPILLEELKKISKEKIVLLVYGGSGVGKSGIASLLAFYLTKIGIQSYTMSGDNYPYRIPFYNDKERERVYAEFGVDGLRQYLGSEYELNYKEVNEIIRQFHKGRDKIFLRRMGREITDLWYEEVSFVNTEVLIIEWTHGNNPNLQKIDIPIFLDSTPEETLEYRLIRNRDGQVDSPFTTLVLKIEQELLASQRNTAKICISRGGKLE